MSIGQDTYIHDVMKLFRLENVYGDKNRYPITDIDEISKLSPRLILLSSEPFPFSEKHVQEIQDALPNTKIELIDGEWFSWYGSRMLPAFKKLKVWREDLSI